MDTREFLHKILPSSGVYMGAVFWKGLGSGNPPKHYHYDTIDELADALVNYDTVNERNVFHACASFKEAGARKESNALYSKSFRVDIDVAKGDADGYNTQLDALKAIAKSVKAIGLPNPMFVSSGKGIHLYWPFTDDVDIADWIPAAEKLKDCLHHTGLKQDKTCTADAARILRPIGTHWRKDGVLDVYLIRDGAATDFADISGIIDTYADDNELSSVDVIPSNQFKNSPFKIATDLADANYPPSSAKEIVKHCAALRHVVEEEGAVAEPLWRGMLGLVKHCTEGEDLCHEWSEGDPNYSAVVTDKKIEGWNAGPTTCTYFAEEGGCDSLCDACPQKGKITSPIRLGYSVENPPEVKTPPPTPTNTTPSAVGSTTAIPLKWVKWNGTHMVALVEVDGVKDWMPFGDNQLYVINRVRDEANEWNLLCVITTRAGDSYEFMIPARFLASKPDLLKELAAREFNTTMGKKGADLLSTYLIDMQKVLTDNHRSTVTCNTLGWNEDLTGFVTGNIIDYGHRRESVVLGKYVPPTWVGMQSKGDVNVWVDAIDKVYNRPGAEAYQFALLAAFASPLVALAESSNWKGIPVALVGDSGTGKSTVAKVGCSIFSNPDLMYTHAADSGVTEKALFGMISAAHNLPFLMDEITEWDGNRSTTLLYSLSNGKGRTGLQQDGSFRKIMFSWASISFVTSNHSIMDMLAAMSNAATEANQVRVFEISFKDHESKALFHDVSGVQDIENVIKNNYGVVGEVFTNFLVKNVDVIKRMVANQRAKDDAGLSLEAKERFYRDLISTVYVAGMIAKKLGLIKFDVNAIYKWALHHIKHLRNERLDRNYSVEEQFAQFLEYLHGHILITRHFNDSRGGSEIPIEVPRNSVLARHAIQDKKLYISRKALSDWCTANNLSASNIIEKFVAQGLIYPQAQNPSAIWLTRGTNVAGARVRCINVDYTKAIDGSTLKLVSTNGTEVADANP